MRWTEGATRAAGLRTATGARRRPAAALARKGRGRRDRTVAGALLPVQEARSTATQEAQAKLRSTAAQEAETERARERCGREF